MNYDTEHERVRHDIDGDDMSRRTQRFNGILDPDMMFDQRVVIVGVGAVGNNLARIIAGMNPGSLVLVDPDVVDEENVGPQMYHPRNIDAPKVAACADSLVMDNAVPLPNRAPSPAVNKYLDMATCVFLCVDSMEARGEIMDYLTREGQQPANCKVIDTRMGAETYQVWDATTSEWTENWFTDAESLPEVCNARSTPWCATMCASHAAFYWSQLLRDEEMPTHIIHDLRTNEVVPVG
tara:strand:- start:941 stop:1651 length:711 start_codon:yes stop_codon:yes gene_type:complete